ncbi:protein strawberry notch homolog 1 isoform X2 [Drosophila serrata]|uniref:protein strawberry notch homolog 1 isoform X2 n=1 Tax=Drosophila serrata TaxID=7274 RepID=UPI000A1CF330|nr:protein strawberry notch homolog 1 isoform X2 [Drosophila serrata]
MPRNSGKKAMTAPRGGEEAKPNRKRAPQRKQKAMPNPGPSNSKALSDTEDLPDINDNFGDQYNPKGKNDDPQPSTSKVSNATKKPSARKRQNTKKSKKTQDDFLDELQDSSESDDQDEIAYGGGQQQAKPPEPKSWTKPDPKKIPKNAEEEENPQLPTQGGKRRIRKKATASEPNPSTRPNAFNEPNLTIKFDPTTNSCNKSNSKKTINERTNKVINESNMISNSYPSSSSLTQPNSRKVVNEAVNITGSQRPTKKAIQELNMGIQRGTNNSGPPYQRGLQMPGKRPPETNLTNKFAPNEVTKNEVKGPKQPIQRGLQTSGRKGNNAPNLNIRNFPKGPEQPHQRDFEPNMTVRNFPNNVTKGSVPPPQRNLQTLGKRAPGPNLNNRNYPNKLMKGSEPPSQKDLQQFGNRAPETTLARKVVPNRGIQPSSQRALQTSRNQAPLKNISNNSLNAAPQSMPTINNKLPIQKVFQKPIQRLPPETKTNIRFEPNKIIKTEGGLAHWGPQNYRKTPGSNAWVKCNANNIPNSGVKPSGYPMQCGSQGSKNTAPILNTNWNPNDPLNMGTGPSAASPFGQTMSNKFNMNNFPNSRVKFTVPIQETKWNPNDPLNMGTGSSAASPFAQTMSNKFNTNNFPNSGLKFTVPIQEIKWNPNDPLNMGTGPSAASPFTLTMPKPTKFNPNPIKTQPNLSIKNNMNNFANRGIKYSGYPMLSQDSKNTAPIQQRNWNPKDPLNIAPAPLAAPPITQKIPKPIEFNPDPAILQSNSLINCNDKYFSDSGVQHSEYPMPSGSHGLNNSAPIQEIPKPIEFNPDPAISQSNSLVNCNDKYFSDSGVQHSEYPMPSGSHGLNNSVPIQETSCNTYDSLNMAPTPSSAPLIPPTTPNPTEINSNSDTQANVSSPPAESLFPPGFFDYDIMNVLHDPNQSSALQEELESWSNFDTSKLSNDDDSCTQYNSDTPMTNEYQDSTQFDPNSINIEEIQNPELQQQYFSTLNNPEPVVKTEAQGITKCRRQLFPTLKKPVLKQEVEDQFSDRQFFPTPLKPIKTEADDPDDPYDNFDQDPVMNPNFSDGQRSQPYHSGFMDQTKQEDLPRSSQSNNQYDGTFINHYAQSVPKNISAEDAARDARLEAELASVLSGGGTNSEPAEQESEPVDEEDAAMDARLQAELDSLPFIEAPVEADDFVEKIFNSFENPAQQAAQPSNHPVPKQVVPPTTNLPKAAPTVPANRPMKMVNLGTLQRPPPHHPGFRNNQRPMSQVPMVAQVTGLQGQIMSLTYTTAPDGLVTSVSTTSPNMSHAQMNELQSLTAAQLHQILQSGQPYLALPMIVPGGHEEELGLKDPASIIAPTGQAVEDEEVDYEEIGVADTFAEYWPSKLNFGVAHPDPVVETATLSSVELPDITYELSLPARTTSCLSALQLEAVVYACQAHEQILPSGERAGFLLGDGAGVGKGRTIAGIIYDNHLKGRKKALWVSVSNDLKFDAERDIHDIGAEDKIPVVAINKFKYSRIDSEDNENFKKGVIFCTYTALIGESMTGNCKYKTRLRQLVNWLGKKFDGVIVFDECHKAKNLSLMNVGKSTKTGTTVLELQKLLPHARVVYASATGASEPRNMAYMVRLGLWGPGTAYGEFFEFVNSVEKRGIGAMEIVAMDMKLRGTYIARQLSFKDVTFRIEEVIMSKEFRKTYNLAAELWAEINKKFLKACKLMCIETRVQKIITCQFWCAHQRFFKNLCIASKVNHVVRMTRQATRMGKAVVIGLQSTGESRTLEHLERHNGKLGSFVSTSKMIIQSFVEKHFPAPKRDSFHRLLNTGEFVPELRFRPPRAKKARMNADWFDDDMDAEAAESDIEMYESTMSQENERMKPGRKRRGRPPKTEKAEKITMQERILQHLCHNMRAQDNDADGSYAFDSAKMQKANITEHDVERCIRAREMLLDKIEVLGRRMPSNTLDKLISELGGTKLVAEMTGRRGRVVRAEFEGYKYEPRCESDTSMDLVNYREKQRFMLGQKNVAIISEAASSGISLQSDKRVTNQRRRLHITLELPWSADRAIQQFGRTHRSNQVNSPEYVFVITDLAGERRFASTVAKRLESLGALTQGDRRATDARDLSQFNIDNSIGRSALENVMQQLTGEKPLDHASVPASYKGDFLYDCSMAMAGVGMLNVREENKVKLFSVEKDSNNISKFLNRILGCRVEVQNALFKFFLEKMYSLILHMKRKGNFDLGILDLDAHGACVKSVRLMRFIRKHATGTAATELHTVTVERGMSYDTALAKYRKEGRHEHEGFYVLQQLRHNKNSAILCLQVMTNVRQRSSNNSPNKISLQLYRPNTGPQVRLETLGSILQRYVKVEPEEARNFWQHQYDVCLNKCSHIFWNRICPFPAGCEVGLRVRPYHVLSGLMLPIWDRIEVILAKSGHKIQIIRVKTNVNKKIVGTVVPQSVYDCLVTELSRGSIVESY